MDKKYETFTYSELLKEFTTVVEKTETQKKDLIFEMAKRKEIEGIEKKKVAAVLVEDLKQYVSSSYIRNTLSELGFTEQKHDAHAFKKEMKVKEQEEEKKILVAAGMGIQELEPSEPRPEDENNDLTSMIQHDNEEQIIDQRPQEEKQPDYSDAEEELDKIHLIRDLKVENNNLTQQINDFDKTKQELERLQQEKSDLIKENTKLKNRIAELEGENAKLKQEVKALRNVPTKSGDDPTPVASKFSNKTHDDYHKSKYYKLTKGK